MPSPTDFFREPEKPVFALLEKLGLPYTNHLHEPVMTVAESAKIKVDMPGGHTKTLFLKDKPGRLVLLSAWAHSQLPLNQLHKRLGTQRLSFTSAEQLWETLAVTPGSVTAYALMHDAPPSVKFVVDAALLEFDLINFHPLRNDMTTSIARADFLRFLDATGHPPEIVDFAALTAPDGS